MNKASYPGLLNKRATILGSLTRKDLILLGITYLILSKIDLSGLWILGITILIFLIFKFIESLFPKGFFQGLRGKKVYEWSYQLGRIYER